MKPQRILCSECGTKCLKDDVFLIDNELVCCSCLFGEILPIQIYPIGFVSNTQKRAKSGFGLHKKNRRSKIKLLPSQKRFLYKLGDETHLTIVYYLHKSRAVRCRFKRGLDGKEVGVFASRTPDRLSKIGIQDVRLVGVKGTTLTVEGLDAIDGTPVLDIKMCWHKDRGKS